jgi:hypothetical protein
VKLPAHETGGAFSSVFDRTNAYGCASAASFPSGDAAVVHVESAADWPALITTVAKYAAWCCFESVTTAETLYVAAIVGVPATEIVAVPSPDAATP